MLPFGNAFSEQVWRPNALPPLSRRQFLCRGNHQDRTALGTLSAVAHGETPKTALPTLLRRYRYANTNTLVQLCAYLRRAVLVDEFANKILCFNA
ncbi:hypothetical protein [Nostoc sp. T09]|uniref:hypothetical protein n=1 Tax=Nostoc sp. T09 TaxID=1932621 RepID=UPI00117D61D8|nr:hypothetical protein [Nostoc sp. T09]